MPLPKLPPPSKVLPAPFDALAGSLVVLLAAIAVITFSNLAWNAADASRSLAVIVFWLVLAAVSFSCGFAFMAWLTSNFGTDC